MQYSVCEWPSNQKECFRLEITTAVRKEIHLLSTMLMYFFLLLNTQHIISLGSSESPIAEYSMAESFVFQDVEYLLCGYRVTWEEAHVICLSYKAQLATLDSELKTDFIVRAIAESSFGFDDFWIGARSDPAGSWSWVSNQQRLATEKSLYENYPPWYPTSPSRKMQCLTIDRRNHDLPIFVALPCSRLRPFVCQKDENAIFARKISMIATTRVGDEEFAVYSARVTWAEAVVQCRKEKLQIAEVRSVEEAHALAMSMLRARPEGIENAWIGGYLKDAIWTWLPSAKEISQDNGLWRNGSRSPHGCLMLDRHMCEMPVYLEAKCDRKRDVVCQKPSRRALSKEPVLVAIEGCKYWVGFYPMQWRAARRTCSELNATLVLLDSERTINQMMKLMLDNRRELKHVWTDGRRSSSPARNSGETLEADWLWESTQERIEESFVPWCNTEKCINGTECLNLDREDYDTPIVYGLDCNHSQTYVCQPLSGPCVSHEIPSSFIDDHTSSPAGETTASKGWPPYRSKTRDRPIATLDENTINAKTFHITLALPSSTTYTNDHGFATLPSSAVLQQFNKSSKNDAKVNIEHISLDNVATIYLTGFTDFLRPFFQLSFPTLPKFGIKVASAQATRAFPILKEKPHDSTGKVTKAPFEISSSDQGSTDVKSTTISLLGSTTRLSDVEFERSRKLLDIVTPLNAEHTSGTQGDGRRRTAQDSEITSKLPNSASHIKSDKSKTPLQNKSSTNAYNGRLKLPLLDHNVSEESNETYLLYSSTSPKNLQSTTVSFVPAAVEVNTISSPMAIAATRRMQSITSKKRVSELQQVTSTSKSVKPINSDAPKSSWHFKQRNQSNRYNSSKVSNAPTLLNKISSMNTLINLTRDTVITSSRPTDRQKQMILQLSPTTTRSTPTNESSIATNSWDVETKVNSIGRTRHWQNSTEVTFQKKTSKTTKNPMKATKKNALWQKNVNAGDTAPWKANGFPDKKKKEKKLKNPFEIHDDAMNSQKEVEKEDEDYLYHNEHAFVGPSATTNSYIKITGGMRKNYEGINESVIGKDTETENLHNIEDKSALLKKLLLDDQLKNANIRRVEQTTVPYSRRVRINAFSLRPYYVLEGPLNINFSSNGDSDGIQILPVYDATDKTTKSAFNQETSGDDAQTGDYTFSQTFKLKSTILDAPNIWDLVTGLKIDFNKNALSTFLQDQNIKQSKKNGESNVSHSEFPAFSNAVNGMNGFQINFNGNPIKVRIKTSPLEDPAVLSESAKLARAGRSMIDDNTSSSNILQVFLRTDKKPKNVLKSPHLLNNFSSNVALTNDSLTRTAELYFNIHSNPYTVKADQYRRSIAERESIKVNLLRNKSLLERLINPKNESDDFYYSIFESMMNSGQINGLNRKRYLLYSVLRQLINMTESDLKLYNSDTVTSSDSLPRDSLIDFQKSPHHVFSQTKNPKIILAERSLTDETALSDTSIGENSPSPVKENQVPTLFISASFGFEENSANKKPSTNLDRH